MGEGVCIQKIGNKRLLFQYDLDIVKKKVMWRGPLDFDRNFVIIRPLEYGS